MVSFINNRSIIDYNYKYYISWKLKIYTWFNFCNINKYSINFINIVFIGSMNITDKGCFIIIYIDFDKIDNNNFYKIPKKVLGEQCFLRNTFLHHKTEYKNNQNSVPNMFSYWFNLF